MSSETTSEIFPKNPQIKENKLRVRRFMCEINEIDKYDQIKKNIMSRKTFRYLIAGKEIAPETGKEHIHMYVEFKQQTIITKLMMCNCHVDIVKPRTKDQAMDYCTKDMNVIDEIGECSHQGSKTVKDLIELKDPSELDPRLFKTWTAVKQWNQSMSRNDIYCPDKQVFFIWGESGSGKSKWVYDQIGDEKFDRVKFSNGFWSGISMDTSVRIAWYDDFRDSHMHPSELINFCDYYRNGLNVKGSNVLDHYDKIYITSVQDPNDIYPNMKDEEPKVQWLRRIKTKHMVKLNGN